MKRAMVVVVVGWCVLAGQVLLGQEKSGGTAKTRPAVAASPATDAGQESSGSRGDQVGAEKSSRADGAESAAKLPVRRVVLYKNGVGYFEHLGRVRGSQDVHIDFTSGQLNDVLKSLTVLDLSGGRITGVDYNSEAPLARRLGTLRLALGERPTQAEFLSALRGARIEVRSGTGSPVTGKLLSVERKTRAGGAPGWTTVETDEISLISDGGEVRSVDLNASTSVRIVDHDLNVEVGKYLSLIAAAREQDVRRMTISTTGTGERNLYVSYISEVPIWKTTYRIVLPTKADKKPLLQGWAIVDNTVGEDWNDVELSLVAGAPHSFIQELSEPYYGRRPVVPLPESVQLSPQTHAATLLGGNGHLGGTVTDQSGATVSGAVVRLMGENGAVVAQAMTDSNGQYSFPSTKPGNYDVQVQRDGFKTYRAAGVNLATGENRVDSQLEVGSTSQTVMVESSGANQLQTLEATIGGGAAGKMAVARRRGVNSSTGFGNGAGGGFAPPPPPMSMSNLAPGVLENSLAGMQAAASGQGLGDLFEYKLKDKVTLKKNQSALVPIAQTEIEAERISLWSQMTTGSGRPLRGLWLKNTSALTLDGGSFSVLDNEVFAGEGLTDAIKPGERRLVSYATDLGLLVDARQNDQPQRITKVKIAKGILTQVRELRENTIYTVRNQDTSARQLVIEHPVRSGWVLKSGTPEEQAPGVYRFRLEVPAQASASLPVDEVHPEMTTYQLSTLNDDQIGLFVQQKTISGEMAEALRKITAQKEVVANLQAEMENGQGDIDRIVDDQGRLRENMKALRGSAEEKALLQRYTKQLDEQETQLDGLRKKIRETEARRDKENEILQKMIGDLQIEATM
ncbi:MAG TPA: carboxypeptidase regulatory-like domain-containing protein [Candidatus Acidoferrum sp.]|jgi:hypothetical protein